MKTENISMKEKIDEVCEYINIPEEAKLKRLANKLDNKVNELYKAIDDGTVTDKNERQMYRIIMAERNTKILSREFFINKTMSEKDYIFELILTLEAVLKH